MNIVEAFKIIKADETKCARVVGVDKQAHCFVGNVLCHMYTLRDGQWTPPLASQYSFSEVSVLADWEVLPIASLNNQEESK